MKYYQGKFTPKTPAKYSGDASQIIYRSSWELKFFIWCDSNPQIIRWCSEEIVIPYQCPTDNKMHRYFPDALITVKSNKDGLDEIKTYLVEIKPKRQTIEPKMRKHKSKQYLTEVLTWGKNSAKWAAAKQYCAQRGYEFIIITEDHLGIKT